MPSSVGPKEDHMASDSQAFQSGQEATSNTLETEEGWFRAKQCDSHPGQPKGRETLVQCGLEQSKVSRWGPETGAWREGRALRSTGNGDAV